MSNTQDFGVMFTVPNYEYSKYDLQVINHTVDAIFEQEYTKEKNVYHENEWQVIYRIQPPVLNNSTAWKQFFKKIRKLLVITRDYSPHFCNDPEAR